MKIAIAYDWLVSRRGGERVLKEFCLCWNDLSIFTLFFDFERVDPLIKRQSSIYVSRLDRLPAARTYYRYLLPWFTSGMESLHVRDKDLLLSISHSVAKGIRHDSSIPHVCYCFTPMRYVWEPRLYEPYLSRSWRGRLLKIFAGRLREWDLQSNLRVDHFVSISHTVKARIKRCYQRESEVIYPCVDLEFFHPSDETREDFYLVVSALVPQKRIEVALEAFHRTGKRLLVVGSGPLRRRLARKAGSNVQFLGRLPDQEVRALYRRARALVFPGVEEFGLVPVEAQACGCPVIAFGEGGVTETVREGKTGVFFGKLDAGSLSEAVQVFERNTWNTSSITANAQRFSRRRFRDEWQQFFRKIGLDVRMDDC